MWIVGSGGIEFCKGVEGFFVVLEKVKVVIEVDFNVDFVIFSGIFWVVIFLLV